MQNIRALVLMGLATSAAVYTAQAQAEAKVYGKIHASVAAVSEDDGVDETNAVAISSHSSRLGIKASQELENGITVSGLAEFQYNTDGHNAAGDSPFKNRNMYVGFAGAFGEVRVGRHTTPHKDSTGKLDIFSDTYADVNNIITVDNRLDDVIAYINQFGNVGLALAYHAGDDDVDGENTGAATSAMVNYKTDALYVSLASENYDTDVSAIETANKLGLGYKVSGLSLGLIYEVLSYSDSNIDDNNETMLTAQYALNEQHSLKAGYGMRDDGDSDTDDAVLTAVGYDYKMDKNAMLYVLYAAGTDGGLSNKGKLDGDASAFAVGTQFKF